MCHRGSLRCSETLKTASLTLSTNDKSKSYTASEYTNPSLHPKKNVICFLAWLSYWYVCDTDANSDQVHLYPERFLTLLNVNNTFCSGGGGSWFYLLRDGFGMKIQRKSLDLLVSIEDRKFDSRNWWKIGWRKSIVEGLKTQQIYNLKKKTKLSSKYLNFSSLIRYHIPCNFSVFK